MASWLVCSIPDRVVRVRVLAGDIALCSWATHFTPTVPLSTQGYEWVPANLMLGLTLRWTGIPSRRMGGGGRNTPSRFMLQKPEISAGLMGLSRLVRRLYLTLLPWPTDKPSSCRRRDRVLVETPSILAISVHLKNTPSLNA